jgi:hypothetical protein
MLPLALFCLVTTLSGSALAGSLPTKVGQCTNTAIKEIGSRLEGLPDSGGLVVYANGGIGVSYEEVPGLRRAKAGDKVKLCLTSLPQDCPPGDNRGITYKATDMRTEESWELPDAEHMCGGA